MFLILYIQRKTRYFAKLTKTTQSFLYLKKTNTYSDVRPCEKSCVFFFGALVLYFHIGKIQQSKRVVR